MLAEIYFQSIWDAGIQNTYDIQRAIITGTNEAMTHRLYKKRGDANVDERTFVINFDLDQISNEMKHPLIAHYALEYRLNVQNIKCIGSLRSMSNIQDNINQNTLFMMDTDIHKLQLVGGRAKFVLNEHLDILDWKRASETDKEWMQWVNRHKNTKYYKTIKVKALPSTPDNKYIDYRAKYGVQQTP